MNKVRVKNLNTHPLIELFKGEDVRIEANDYWRDKDGKIKEMDIFEANDFRGQYHPVPFDGSGKMVDDPKHYKMVLMEPVDGVAHEVKATHPFNCMAPGCKDVFRSEKELSMHTEINHANLEALVLPEVDAQAKRSAAKK